MKSPVLWLSFHASTQRVTSLLVIDDYSVLPSINKVSIYLSNSQERRVPERVPQIKNKRRLRGFHANVSLRFARPFNVINFFDA